MALPQSVTKAWRRSPLQGKWMAKGTDRCACGQPATLLSAMYSYGLHELLWPPRNSSRRSRKAWSSVSNLPKLIYLLTNLNRSLTRQIRLKSTTNIQYTKNNTHLNSHVHLYICLKLQMRRNFSQRDIFYMAVLYINVQTQISKPMIICSLNK